MTERVLLEEVVVEIRNGFDAEQVDQQSNGMLPISRIETIWNGTIDFDRVKYANVSQKEIDKYALKSGDILFSHINSPEHIGKTGLYRSEQTLIHGINLLLIRVNQEKCHPEYLNYYFKSKNVRALFRARCKKAVNQASLNQPDILSLEIPLPPLTEQKRIASLLARADRLRSLRRTARDLGDSLLQSVFLEMFGEAESNPTGWDKDEFEKAIVSTQNGFGQREDYSPKGIIVLRIRDISSGKIDYSDPRRMIILEKELTKYSLDHEDLILVRVNGNPNYVGIASEFAAQNEPIVFSDHVIRVKMNRKLLNTTFMVHLLNSPYGRKQTLGNISTTAGQFTINSSGLSRIKVIFPPLSLQEEFASVVRRVEQMRARQAEGERQAQGLFESLLALSFVEGLNQSFCNQ